MKCYIYGKMTHPNIQQIIEKYRNIRNSRDATSLQVAVWSKAFLAVTGETQYALESYLSERHGRSKADRIRYFRNIAQGYRPSRKHPSRAYDIVEDLHEEFGHPWLKQWLHSPFWHVISKDFSKYASQPSLIRRVLAESILIARETREESSGSTATKRYFEFDEPLRSDRQNSVKRRVLIPDFLLGPVNFDQLAVLGLMYREAYIGCAIGYALQIRTLFLDKLHEMIRSDFIATDLKKPLFDLSVQRILFPISQYSRHKAMNLEKTFRMIANSRDADSIGFIKAHDRTLLNP